MWKQVLVISAHSDDGIVGAGGTIIKLLEGGVKVAYLYFVLPPISMNEPAAQQETDDSLSALGLSNVIHYKFDNYANRTLHEHRQEVLDELVWVYRQLRPDLVFTPSGSDTHQDHAVVAIETFRACKKSTMLGYDFHWNMPDSHLSCYISLQQKHVDKKIAAIQMHSSQLFRPQLTKESITALAAVRGIAIGEPFAEAFEVIRWVW